MAYWVGNGLQSAVVSDNTSASFTEVLKSTHGLNARFLRLGQLGVLVIDANTAIAQHWVVDIPCIGPKVVTKVSVVHPNASLSSAFASIEPITASTSNITIQHIGIPSTGLIHGTLTFKTHLI